MSNLFDLCKKHTLMCDEDIYIIEKVAKQLQITADVAQADMFIDCPTRSADCAIVVAQVAPATAQSLYQSSVIGQMAYARNEPAVLFSLLSGMPIIEHRGISQEGSAMQQNVVPIKNDAGATIGVLIKEHDISGQLEHEKHVELLLETTEQLSDSLLRSAMMESRVPSLIHDGIVLIDENDTIGYANAQAVSLLNRIGYGDSPKGKPVNWLFDGKCSSLQMQQKGGVLYEELHINGHIILLKAVVLHNRDFGTISGSIVLLHDITELKEKEKQLMIKSAVIKEIHHRVKNNLQTITGLLRMQVRRTDHVELKTLLRESINRINSIAAIHDILAQSGLESINVHQLIGDIADMIVGSQVEPEKSIEVVVTGAFPDYSSDKATTLALIVTELIQNSILHGFKDTSRGKIEIHCEEYQYGMKLSIQDNGCGIGDREEEVTGCHLGLQIVETLVVQDLEGSIRYLNNGNGTTVTLQAPRGR